MKESKNFQDNFDNFTKKAEKIMFDYNKATGSSICIYNSEYKPHFPSSFVTERNPDAKICPYCSKFCTKKDGNNEYPCHEMHIEAINEACSKGKCHIYQCGLGLLFWVSPIYTEGVFSGAIRGSGFFTENKKYIDFFSNSNDTVIMSNDEVSKDEFKTRANSFPEADGDKVQSLAEMMQLCAESLSSGSEDYHETIKRRAQQQEAISKIIEQLKQQYPCQFRKAKLLP